ncbi:ComEA family DNA-binding protein [Salinicoccus roseus]|uniref:ComEA family DNA-binding protein n=1 Tax=Salinicoccus roseus TaxID=45670 RepID=A0ABT4YL03_9STAP|nr:ComEA family DNA-binding protein [Salinicoccus roseus]MDB0581392.1 ComEA family DNA-binding protein [Salinicoccus roseus]
MFDEKNLTLNVYDTDAAGKPVDYSVTTMRQPKENCLSVKISIRESLQVERLRVKMQGTKPYTEHAEALLEVVEGEYGYQLVQPKPALVNINTADIAELTTLEGIGETKAQAIIDYRTENGPFEAVEGMLNVSGIGDSLFTSIQSYITV